MATDNNTLPTTEDEWRVRLTPAEFRVLRQAGTEPAWTGEYVDTKTQGMYECRACGRRFDDLTGTIFADHRQPLRTWIACLYLMGLNQSGLQIAKELDINKDDARAMIGQLRQGIVDRRPPATLSGEVECDEVYVVAGHKGHPEAVKRKAGPGGDGV